MRQLSRERGPDGGHRRGVTSTIGRRTSGYLLILVAILNLVHVISMPRIGITSVLPFIIISLYGGVSVIMNGRREWFYAGALAGIIPVGWSLGPLIAVLSLLVHGLLQGSVDRTANDLRPDNERSCSACGE